jgi:sn-glycerol 3-phosphate transport system permease protein
MASTTLATGKNKGSDVQEARWAGQRKSYGTKIIGFALMILAVLAIGLPVYWMIIGAFKTSAEIYRIPPTWIPAQPTLANFPNAWNAAPFGRYYINSTITTLMGTGFELYFAITSAYAFQYLRFPFKEPLFIVLLAALMIPAQITILPNYITVADFGWINSYWGIVVPGAATAYGTFLLRQYFRTLPTEVLDAAKVDGASHWRMMWSIVFPLAKPGIITFLLISLVAKWNDFLWPLIVTNTREMRTLPIGIYWLRAEQGNIDWGMIMAGTLFVVLPVAIIFLFAQRYIVSGIAAGAVKG